jgi:hypothetical protein
MAYILDFFKAGLILILLILSLFGRFVSRLNLIVFICLRKLLDEMEN